MSDTLFPVHPVPADDRTGSVRYETVNRAQVELFPCDLEALLPPGHAARLVWRFVEGLDLSAFYATIKAREGGPGRTPIDPKLLIALWLYATIDGVGSAREIDRLSAHHDAYRWIRGGVSVNYHTLSDFRVAHHAALSGLLTQSIAALLHGGIVTLARVAQDGTRVRASAGAGSFRRGPSLHECVRTARQQVERTQRQADTPMTATAAAQARVAQDRLARVDAALAILPEVEAIKKKRGKKGRGEPRVSTTDPEARVMKMADGGFRPAYNVQFATDVDGRGIVGVQVTNVGSDQGQLTPMLAEIERRTGRRPGTYLVDGGFLNHGAIQQAATRGSAVYAPLPPSQNGRDPATPVVTDTPAMAAWRAEMATPHAAALRKARGATAEWVNADARTHRTLNHIPVRGLIKVHTWVLWIALAHNLLRLTGLIPHLMT
jgi:transposase